MYFVAHTEPADPRQDPDHAQRFRVREWFLTNVPKFLSGYLGVFFVYGLHASWWRETASCREVCNIVVRLLTWKKIENKEVLLVSGLYPFRVGGKNIYFFITYIPEMDLKSSFCQPFLNLWGVEPGEIHTFFLPLQITKFVAPCSNWIYFKETSQRLTNISRAGDVFHFFFNETEYFIDLILPRQDKMPSYFRRWLSTFPHKPDGSTMKRHALSITRLVHSK